MKKTSMAVPISPEIKEKLKKSRLYLLMDHFKRLPKTTIKDLEAIIQEIKSTGASEFFNNIDLKTVIQLPAITVVDPKKIFELNGFPYVAVDVLEPKLVGRKSSINGKEYLKGDQYPGEIIAINLSTGELENLNYQENLSKIKAPQENRQQTLEKANQEIKEYNKKLESISKAAGASRIVLQVSRAEEKINERLNTLNEQIQAIEKNITADPETLATYQEWNDFLKNGIKNNEFNVRDVYDTLIFLYQSNPNELINGIQNGEINIPEELKNGVMAIAAQENKNITQEKLEEEQKELDRSQRITDPLPIDQTPEETPIQEYSIDDIPEEKYKTTDIYKTFHHWINSNKFKLQNIKRDYSELQTIKNDFEALRSFMGALEKGQRANDFLRSEEGQPILTQLKKFLDDSQLFIKRYSSNIIQDDGKVNTKLMGRAGSIGNALVAVSLFRIYSVIKKTIDDIENPVIQPEKIPVQDLQPVSKTSIFIKKISNVLWDAFIKRNSLK